jgi:isoamylase
MGRTQRGNNNAYCQDNVLSWTDWDLDDERRVLLGYTQAMVRLRQAHPVFRRIQFFRGVHTARGEKDITWLRPDGHEMTEADWSQPLVPAVGMMLAGDGIPQVDDEGDQVVDDTFLVLLSSSKTPVSFVVPAPDRRSETALWTVVVDTRVAKVPAGGQVAGGGAVVMAPYSAVVLRWTP